MRPNKSEQPEQPEQEKKDDGESYSKFRIGGYGELVASFLNYGKNRFYGGTSDDDTRRTVAMPRVVLAGDYRFNADWNLGMEIEFEAGGVGIEQELEKDEPKAAAVDMGDNPLNFRIVEQLPEFPGGMSAYVKWLTKNLKYPLAAQKQKIEGRVVVSFVINRDGSLTDIKVSKSANPILDS